MTTIHPTAIVDGGAKLGEGVVIGPYSVVGPDVSLGAGVKLKAHVFIDGFTTVGDRCEIFPFASIGTRCQDLKYKGARTFVSIGNDTVIRECVTVNSSTEEGHATSVGSGVFLMAYSHVAHECSVGDGVIMGNGVQLAGHVTVEALATISGMSGVHQFVRIGTMAFVGGMSRISQDVPPYMLVEGNPPVARGPNAIGLRRRNMPAETRELLKDAYRMLYRENLSTPQALERIRKELKPCPEIVRLVEFVAASERGITK